MSIVKLSVLSFLALILTGGLCFASPSIDNIRTSVRDGVQRIVFDITGEKTPAYYIKRDRDNVFITFEALIDQRKQRTLSERLKNTSYVSNVEFLTLPDEVETVVILKLRDRPSIKEFFALSSPPRVVVDLEK